ncbi:hypothetical protein L9F63_000285 [Diploptera punctata]|uniref:CCA tRNA nucleotidyltransferase 1, mitochondrial n=1 Tax=Diploptera punctata TaxID=6984 RepID=A0AAD8ETX1_DIPPU|nr:hypothetical protein L9F63_000285 [Diploptera punctata]
MNSQRKKSSYKTLQNSGKERNTNVVRQYVPVIMKLDSPEFKALFTPELVSLVSLFKEYGHELRIAGGAVRDLLMKIEPKDLDFATTATPDQMKEMFNAEGIRMINTKGERHDWKLDANRRDLTINSMFLGLDGTVYDYFDGYKDLQARRVVFVGDASTRIREDYLRILRYFRFYGRIAEQSDNHEENTLEAIRHNAAGLEIISGERIWTELRKILEGRFAGELVKIMISLGLNSYIGLPAQPNIKEFDRVWSLNCPEKVHPMTLLAALLTNQEEVMKFHARVKLSAYERDLTLFIVENRQDKPCVKPLQPYQLLIVNSKGKTSDTREWVREVLKYRGDFALLKQFDQWILPRFPINGNILKENGVPGGKILGPVMNALKHRWVENDFQLSSEELLKFLPEVLDEIGVKPKR